MFSSSGIPLYVQLAELLRRRVRTGTWIAGSTLPPIPMLMREFAVARVTVRQAIGLLTAEGLLSPQRGRGTFVTGEAKMQRGLKLRANLHELVDMYRGDRPDLATLTIDAQLPRIEGEDGTPAPSYTHIRRVHARRGERYCIISIYLDTRVYERAPQRFREELALEVLTSLTDVRPAGGEQVLTISGADPETAELLGIPLNTPMADVRRLLRDAEGTVIYVAEITYRGDTIQLEMDFKT